MKGEDYRFELLTKNSEEDPDDYSIPSSLDIKVDGKEIFRDAYKIEEDPTQPTKKAFVTIYGKYVTGDIKVTAIAKKTDNFNYLMHNYGTVEKISSGNILSESGIQPSSKDFSFYIVNKEVTFPIKKVYKENVVVSLDGGEYVTAASEMEKSIDERRFTFNDFDQKFVLKAGQATKSLEVFTRLKDYNILDDLTWDQIKTLTDFGFAKDVFFIGETKEIKSTLNSENIYTARIIDFNHDILTEDESKKAGITFEFEQLISDSDGNGIQKSIVQSWGEYKFEETPYSKYLNEDFYKTLDIDLTSNIKNVNKTAYKNIKYSSLFTYSTKLFPLSLPEMDYDYQGKEYRKDGLTYQYYIENTDKSYCIKKDLNGNALSYWTRSKKVESLNYYNFFIIKSNGSNDYKHSLQEKYCYTAAFCI